MTKQANSRAGRKTEYDWDTVEAELYRIMDAKGDFSPEKKGWTAQARLEDALLDFCGLVLGREPSPAVLRRKLPEWLGAWRARQHRMQAAE